MNIRFSALVLGVVLGSTGGWLAWAQPQPPSLSEALDTPDRTWTPAGSVMALNDPALAHDGVDSVRLDPFRSPETGVFESSITTELAVPSVVEFWHRSRDLDGVTVLGINNMPSGNSSVWKLQRTVAAEGRLEISNKGEPGAGPRPLYLDSVSVRPAALVSLAEALDWPAPVSAAESGSPATVLGLAEPWLAPDGVDAVYFSRSGTYIETTVSGPGLLSYRSLDPRDRSGVRPLVRSDNSPDSPLPEFSLGDRTWFRAPETGAVRFQKRPDGVSTAVMDGLEALPAVPVEEALDAPGLNLTLSGAAAGASRIPSGASDGDAVLCLEDPVPGGAGGGRITLTVPGPAVVRFEYLGTGQCIVRGGWHHVDSAVWRTGEFKVYGPSETITWQGGLWVNAVSVQPPAPGGSVAELLDAPGLIPEFPTPVYLNAVPGSTEGNEALSIQPVSPEASLDPLIRLPFPGPSVVSFGISGSRELTRLRMDGGPWRTIENGSFRILGGLFVCVTPGEGTHFLEVAGPAGLDRFQTVPLEDVPLAEALDAPDLAFTTSPGVPWKGYKVPGSTGFAGGHAASGGQPAEGEESWIETRVEGPGVLEFSLSTPALISIDGAAARYTAGAPDGVPLSAGPHTVRWIWKGDPPQAAPSPGLWLDRVSLTPGTPSLSEALDTPGRSWTAHGAPGEVLPVKWAGGSPDGVDSVQLRSVHAWVETVVNLPAVVNFTGRNLLVTDGAGKVIANQGWTASLSYFRKILDGAGPALLRFSPSENGFCTLDQVEIFEATDRITPAAVSAASGIEWRSMEGKPWSILSNPVTGEIRYGAAAPLWLEAVVPGPCVVMTGRDMTLPDHGNRQVVDGRIHYPGPQRVLLALKGADSAEKAVFFATDSRRPALDLAESMKKPGLTWTSGGEAPWMSLSPGEAVSAPVWPGEVSWIEAGLTGPGVLSWTLAPEPGSSATLITDVLCDGVALPQSGPWLHLTPGPHRVRWQLTHRLDGARNIRHSLRLSGVDYTPQPAGSVTEILGSGLNLSEALPYGPNFSAPVMEPWPAARGWRAGSDPVTGAPVLEADHGAGLLTTVGPVPGIVTSRLKMERGGPLGFTVINTLPAAAAPFSWTNWTSQAPVWPLAEGYRTSAAGVVFTPFTPVSIGEALDQPDPEWTADSNPPGLWKALTGASPALSDDPDGLYVYGMAMGDTAWLETTVTGPLEVATRFGKSSNQVEPGFRILLNGVPVADENRAGSPLRVPAGSHRLRWEIAPVTPIPLGRHAVIRGVTLAPGGPLPDLNDFLDAPQLKWGLVGAVPTAVTGELAHDGVDALNLGTGTGQTVLTLGLEGPGLVSFWMKGHPGLGEPMLDGLAVPFARTTPPTPLTAWRKITLPVPAGPHTCQFRGPGLLDEFNWQPLPALTPEEALDAPEGVTVTMPHPTLYGAAAWPDFSDDGTDSLLIMPGQARRLEVRVPPLSTLSLRVRAAFGTGTFGFQDLDSWPTATTAWTTRTFSTRTDAGISTVYLRASLTPALIDRLTITPAPAAGLGYFPWADSHGLAAARNQPLADPDNDGWSNLLEYSLGQNPTTPDSAPPPGTDTVPGSPETTVWTDPATGLTYPEVRYWRRTGQTAIVETAQDPQASAWMGDPAGWTPTRLPGTVTTPGPEGWSRVVWRSAEPVAGGGAGFVRVRYSPF